MTDHGLDPTDSPSLHDGGPTDAVGDGNDETLPEDPVPAEEAALRVTTDPGGLNDDPDPGYLDHDEA
jgi:hypothetical protein